MKYDFDTIIPRRGTNSYKWDTPEEENVLPMWVADMDFRTAPAIIDALQKRVAHGIFGYTKVPEAYYDAVVRWFDDHNPTLLPASSTSTLCSISGNLILEKTSATSNTITPMQI